MSESDVRRVQRAALERIHELAEAACAIIVARNRTSGSERPAQIDIGQDGVVILAEIEMQSRVALSGRWLVESDALKVLRDWPLEREDHE